MAADGFLNVMAALVAAIHVFRAASKDVDGRLIPGTWPGTWGGHDVEKPRHIRSAHVRPQ
jgi:hypothetical protein